MPPSETIQKLSFDGPLSIGQLIILGFVVTVITGFFTLRECKTSASLKLFALLFPLRLAALSVVLWMLAGATLTTLLREFKPRSVVLLVDSSASMGIVDPVDGSGNSLSWAVAQKKAQSIPDLAILDSAIGMLRSAQSAIGRIGRLNQIADST